MRPIMRGFCWAALLVLALGSVSSAEMATRRWGSPPRAEPVKAKRLPPPTGYVAQARAAPVIDGKLDDACWQKASALGLASTLDGGASASVPTEVRLLCDEEQLYVAFRCAEPFMTKLKDSGRSQDGPFWNDDSVEMFLGVADSGAYYHFGFTAFGSTYDARLKDASWNSGMKVAVARGREEWTVEAAIPLEKLVGKGKPPERWIGNFTRNRHTRDSWEELAWSPTYSGDSHVIDRFGQILLKEPPAGEAPAVPPPAAAAGPEVEVLPCQGGQGVVRFDLAALKGAKVHRADLAIFRTAQITGANEEALIDIDIRPLFKAFSARQEPEASAQALEPRAPWYDRFDATEAVRAWASGKPNGGFFVKVCPLWRADATCLEVAYEGKPEKVPPQAKGLQVLHRSGQTFVTWQEVEDLVGKDAIAWGAMRSILLGMDRAREVRYGVYRSDRPITAATLPQAELLAVVKPLSGWNINGRNIDQPIDQVIATQDVLICGQWNPFQRATVDGDYGRDCPIERLVIREGDPPLARATGLYVHTASRKAKAHYAVVTSIDGVQNTVEISKENATQEPVEETPAEPEPVLQRELPKMPFFNYRERRLHYVRWEAPPYTNVPYQYYNWSVGIPEGLGDRVPLELSLHRDGYSYYRTQYRLERDSLVLSPHDFPLKTWWYGYHECLGTLRSFRKGCVQNYTERRLLAFIDWAAKKWPVDRQRVLVTGSRGGASGSGALHLGLRNPGTFSLVVAGHGTPSYADSKEAAPQLEPVFGKVEWGMKTDQGKNVWEELDLVKLAAELPARTELPLVTMTSSAEAAPVRAFYRAMLSKGRPLIAEFSWGGGRLIPVSVTGTYPNNVRLDVRSGAPLLAFRTAEAMNLIDQAKMGEFNRDLRWRSDDLVDRSDRFEVTLLRAGPTGAVKADVTVRRLERFKVQPGKTCAWETRGPDGTKTLQNGQVTVGDDGLLVLKDVEITSAGVRLVVTGR